MATKTWIATVGVIFAVVLACVAGGGGYALRSEHSRPAVRVPQQQVVVTKGGMLFHKPDCKYIKGERQTMSGEEAEREGYAPCTRCFHELLAQR